MPQGVMIIGTERDCGMAVAGLGLAGLLAAKAPRMAVFRPIGPGPDREDHLAHLLSSHFGLDAVDVPDVNLPALLERAGSGPDDAFDKIMARFKGLQATYDCLLCLGTDMEEDPSFEFDCNAQVAANLACPVVLAFGAAGRRPEELAGEVAAAVKALAGRGVAVAAVAVSRYTGTDADGFARKTAALLPPEQQTRVMVLPETPRLASPSLADVRSWLGAEVLSGEKALDTAVSGFLVAAMQAEHFLEYLSQDCLVITPGDRSDIALATVVSRHAPDFPRPAGLLLTGGFRPSAKVTRLFGTPQDAPLPVLATDGHTYATTSRLEALRPRIHPEDTAKIDIALALFDAATDREALRASLLSRRAEAVTPRMFEFGILERAKAAGKRIVLAEGGEERVQRAAETLLRRRIMEVVLLGDPEAIKAQAQARGIDLSGADIRCLATDPQREDFAATLYGLRKHKGLTLEAARDLVADKTYFGTLMVYAGQAHGMVSGATTTTAETIRPALQCIKTRPGVGLVSSVFFMCLADRVLLYGDCAVNPDPTAEELAQIAWSAAATARSFGIEPRVAMLSYSSGASGKGPDVDKVRQATSLLRQRAPDLPVEGPIQYDAAVDPATAREKLPDSAVAGKATVCIFPDLDTGNIAYKAVQRSSGAVAMGPVLQGLNKPVNDLSRGCTVTDIVYTAAITAIQAAEAP
ncbi:MAG: phosphate acetyltransferase [Solidesulfovibrio sp. DCME]|uniref:phosphate acetyltransferase n=1 Tax=Solidesulfovibrio sp. DCME TaxID=3447380 RepID=UPI003D107479